MTKSLTYPNGKIISSVDGQNSWLIINGRRHYIASKTVFHDLFLDTVISIPLDDLEIEAIPLGYPLSEGSCLARAVGDLTIYLISGRKTVSVRKHKIANYEAFEECGFDLSKVQEIPVAIMSALQTSYEVEF